MLFKREHGLNQCKDGVENHVNPTAIFVTIVIQLPYAQAEQGNTNSQSNHETQTSFLRGRTFLNTLIVQLVCSDYHRHLISLRDANANGGEFWILGLNTFLDSKEESPL